jgi:hypothetical protein
LDSSVYHQIIYFFTQRRKGAKVIFYEYLILLLTIRLFTGLMQNVPNVGANGIRPYDTIEVITFLCVSPDLFFHAKAQRRKGYFL